MAIIQKRKSIAVSMQTKAEVPRILCAKPSVTRLVHLFDDLLFKERLIKPTGVE